MTEQSPSVDGVLDAVSHRYRRGLLTCLREHGPSMPVPDVADELAVREYERTLDAVPAEEVKRIYMSLYHEHIPKLEEFGAVTYHQEADTVALAAHADPLLDVIEAAESVAE